VKFPGATHLICCFQYEGDARAFYQLLIPRLTKYNLEIADEKTRIIAFGKEAEETKLGGGKPSTFDFLGFTHYCGKGRKGQFRVKRKTSAKKFRASLLRCKVWLQQNRNLPVFILMKLLRVKMLGYYRYYGVTDNIQALKQFDREVQKLLFKWLNRRSQRRSFSFDKFNLFLIRFPLPRPKIYVNIYALKPEFAGCMR
jgi:hypothetical protein